MWGVLIFGIASAVQYFLKFWRKVDDSIKHSRRKELLRLQRQRKRAARALSRSESKAAPDATAELR